MPGVLGWLQGIDERVTGARRLEPPSDHRVARDLWSQMSDEHRRRLQWETYWARSVNDPSDAVVQLALLDHYERGRVARRVRWGAAWAVAVVAIVAFNLVAFGEPRLFAPAIVMLVGLGNGALLAVFNVRTRRMVRELVEARAALYQPDVTSPSTPTDAVGGTHESDVSEPM
jgi:hypothetical protein